MSDQKGNNGTRTQDGYTSQPRMEKTGGYTPPQASDTSKNVPIPPGGSGASGSPSAGVGSGQNNQGEAKSKKQACLDALSKLKGEF
ncbi:MAG: hypothetical protein ACRC10_02545 [Thermoguttaceae bacterium]